MNKYSVARFYFMAVDSQKTCFKALEHDGSSDFKAYFIGQGNGIFEENCNQLCIGKRNVGKGDAVAGLEPGMIIAIFYYPCSFKPVNVRCATSHRIGPISPHDVGKVQSYGFHLYQYLPVF